MSTAKRPSDHVALRLAEGIVRVWVVGFALAARGTLRLGGKILGLLPFTKR